MNQLNHILEYYDSKVNQYGATPAGVDWNGISSQITRFKMLTKIIEVPSKKQIKLDDYGCGYGAYLKYLIDQKFSKVNYLGLDISSKMIRLARNRFGNNRFIVASSSPRQADYAIASGIFNVCLDSGRKQWIEYIKTCLIKMHLKTKKGFAFNCLTSYSEPRKRKKHLFYADPSFFFDFCKKRFSSQVALLHDYGLFEFTILVRKRLLKN